MNKNLLLAGILMLVFAVLYRMVPYEMRPEWFGTPLLAIALFAGSVIKNKKWAFLAPLAVLLLSDVISQLLHVINPAAYQPGFYQDMFWNYAIILAITALGFMVNPSKLLPITLGLIAAPFLFFLLSNFVVWVGNTGLQRPKNWQGLVQTYVDGLPFIRSSFSGTLLFGVVLFGGWNVLRATKTAVA